MFVNDTHIETLRAAYKRRLLTDSITAALSLAATVVLLMRPGVFVGYAWIIAVCAGGAAAVADYCLERALYRKGKNPTLVFVLSMILPAIVLSAFFTSGILSGIDGQAGFPYFPAFLLFRFLIPLIQLLRDGMVLKEGRPCESVGRMKENTRRVENGLSREYFMLFEDELTHEIHLIRMSSLSPEHRYRIFFLPHSGLAVGEVIPDGVTFDPFGNPIMPKSADPTSVEPSVESTVEITEKTDKPRDSRFDPNSPQRQQAAKLEKAGKICIVVTIAFFILTFALAFLLQESSAMPLSVLLLFPGMGGIFLSIYLQNKRLKLICTVRTDALCIDTVRRKSGKTTTRHPIVEYTVDGVLYTKELPISCRKDAVGETYTIYYDPLDPEIVRAR